jgi:hypothetical protein
MLSSADLVGCVLISLHSHARTFSST